jgi:hypothetical protein
MAIDIRKISLLPVRRDGQIASSSGSSYSSLSGGGSVFADTSTVLPIYQDASLMIYYEASTNSIRVNANIYAYGDVAAFVGENAPINWWDSLPQATASVLGGIKLGNGLYLVNGKVDVSVNTGGIGDVTKVYVDGSLGTRDSAISGKQPQLNGTGFVKASGTTISYDNNTYLTGITSGLVTGALGYTPYNATNPDGYITSSALSPYAPLSNSFKQVTYQDLNVYDQFTDAKYGLTHINTPTGDFGYYQSYGSGSYGAQTFIDYSGNDYFYYRGVCNGTPRAWKQLAPVNNPSFTGTVTLPVLSAGGLQLGSNSSYSGKITYDDAGQTVFSFDNTWNSNAAVTKFRMKTAGNPIDALTIMGSGYVGLGTAPETKLHIKHDVNTGWSGDNDQGVAIENTYNTDNFALLGFRGYSTDYPKNLAQIGGRFTGTGSYLYFGTSNNYAAGITNSALVIDYNSNTSINGNAYVAGEVTAYYSSDERLKSNIKPFKALDIINKLKPVTFNWNDKAKELNNTKDDRINYGLIAHEVEQVLPELIHEIFKEYKSVDYVQLVPVLIQAIKEQQQQNKYLRSDLEYVLKNFHK